MNPETDRRVYNEIKSIIDQPFEMQADRMRETVSGLSDEEIQRGINFLRNHCELLKLRHNWED